MPSGRLFESPEVNQSLREQARNSPATSPSQVSRVPSAVATRPEGCFPAPRLVPGFRHIAQCYKQRQGILVVILTQTVFEALFENFRWTLMDRMEVHAALYGAVDESLRSWGAFDRFMRGLTGLGTRSLCKEVGYGHLIEQLQEIRRHRNRYLHGAAYGRNFSDDLVRETLQTCCDIIDMFAELHSTYHADHSLFDHWPPGEPL